MGTLYKSLIGQCADCCTCDAPVFEQATRSASKTKCGFVEYSAAGRDPNKRYLSEVASGYYNRRDVPGCTGSYDYSALTWSGANTYNPATCGSWISGMVVAYSYDIYNVFSNTHIYDSGTTSGGPYSCSDFENPPGCVNTITPTTDNSTYYLSTPCSGGTPIGLRDLNATRTLTDEYTTATLKPIPPPRSAPGPRGQPDTAHQLRC